MTKQEKILKRALEMMAKRFISHGRIDCFTLRCPEYKTYMCKGKREKCFKAHIGYYIRKAKEDTNA